MANCAITRSYIIENLGLYFNNVFIDILEAIYLFPKLFDISEVPSTIWCINFFSFLFCSYQAVAYIEASAVIYQDGKVAIFFMLLFSFWEKSMNTSLSKKGPKVLSFVL